MRAHIQHTKLKIAYQAKGVDGVAQVAYGEEDKGTREKVPCLAISVGLVVGRWGNIGT